MDELEYKRKRLKDEIKIIDDLINKKNDYIEEKKLD